MAARSTYTNARTQHVNGLVTDLSSALDSLLQNLPEATPDAGNRRLRNFFHETYQTYRLSESSEKTTDDYVRAIEHFAQFLKRPVTLDDLTDDVLSNFLLWPRNLPRAIPTVRKYRRQLLALWRFAWKKRLVDELPRDVIDFKAPKIVPKAWSVEEFGRMIAACDVLTCPNFDIDSAAWWRALLWTLYETGLRIGAAILLKIDALDFETGWLTVPADVQKQKADQVFKLHPDTVAAIQFSEPHAREYLFPQPYNQEKYADYRKHFYRRLNTILDAAGLPKTCKDKFHKIRKTCATLIADLAGDEAACRHLGHSTVALTRAVYLDPRYIRRRIITAAELPRPKLVGDEPEAA